MYAINLKTEYLKNPMGIDIRNPRLMWNCKDGIRQSAYQIICKDDNEKILWDSGKVTGTAMQAVYNGERLKSRTKVLWKVRLWDENDQEGEWSQETFFELGLMARTNWMARWITGNYEVDRKKRYPVDCFLKEIVIEKEVRKARLYVTACGLYEARIDSRKVGNFCLAPGITDYRKRVQYQTYDVTDMVGKGSHRLTIWLADGWYRGSTGAWGLRNQYGTETKLLAQLELFYEEDPDL